MSPSAQGPGAGWDLVPTIGTRWRWYDIPYRFFGWLLSGWRHRFIPWRLRLQLTNGRNFLYIINEYERLKIEPRTNLRHHLIAPDDETVTQGALWTVEFFPPSHYDDLVRSLKKNGWSDSNLMSAIEGSNAEQMAQARQGRGFLWSRLGAVANPRSPYLGLDAKREVLPRSLNWLS